MPSSVQSSMSLLWKSLAASRPLFLELGPLATPDVYPTLVSEGLWSRVLPDGVTQGDERLALSVLKPRLGELRHRLTLRPAGHDGAARVSEALVAQATQSASLHDQEAALELFGLAAQLTPDDPAIPALMAGVKASSPAGSPERGQK